MFVLPDCVLGLQTEQEAGGEVLDVIHTLHVVTILSEITCNTEF